MKNFQIKQSKTGKTLFKGKFKSFRECLEQAIEQNINLDGADISNQNLSNINIDSAQLSNVSFKNCNLNQANLSEGQFHNVDFSSSNMIGACMAESLFSECDFCEADFGANILTDSVIKSCKFNTLSAFLLPFYDLKNMHLCSFMDHNKHLFTASKPPTAIIGLSSSPIIISGKSIFYGHTPIKNHSRDLVFLLKQYNLNVHKKVDTSALKKI